MSYFPGITRRPGTSGGGGVAAPPVSGGGQSYSGVGLPSITPANPSLEATFESLDLNVFFRWDTSSSKWRSMGQLREEIPMNITPNTWTRIPPAALLTSIDEHTIYRSTGEVAGFIESRRSSVDGWPELRSLNAYSGLIARCFGEVSIP
jgi:hypothetical protein